jgi:hypothetical protein
VLRVYDFTLSVPRPSLVKAQAKVRNAEGKAAYLGAQGVELRGCVLVSGRQRLFHARHLRLQALCVRLQRVPLHRHRRKLRCVLRAAVSEGVMWFRASGLERNSGRCRVDLEGPHTPVWSGRSERVPARS